MIHIQSWLKTIEGNYLGGVAKEQAHGCYRMLQQIKSLSIQHKANFIQLATKQHRHFQSTSVHFGVNYFVDEHVDGDYYDNKMKQLEDLTKQCKLSFVSKKRDLLPKDTPFENPDENLSFPIT